MSQNAIFWPMLAHVALVYAIYVLMFFRRRQAVRHGSVKVSQFRENRDEPAESLFVRNNLANQFELPVLFHAGCLALFVTGWVGWAALAAAWVFAVSRWLHAYVHVTSNRLRYRQPAFTVGFVAVGFIWLLLAFGLLAG